MLTLIQSDEFLRWHATLPDKRIRARVSARLRLAQLGNFGDWKPLRESISEMRIDTGPGYRLYFTRRGTRLIILLCGGNKSTQKSDIKRALQLSQIWQEANPHAPS